MHHRAIALSLICMFGPMAFAAPLLDDHVRSVVNTWVQNGELSSVVIGVVDGSGSAVYGFGKVGVDAPDGQTVFEIGSVTKTFTALLLANAVQAGTVKLNDPVATLLPTYVIPEFAGKPITLLDLATHTSCLPDIIDGFDGNFSVNPLAQGVGELKNFLATYRLPCAPGSTFAYSSVGYGLLAQALTVQAKTSYADMVARQITTPLGMPSTGIKLTPAMQSRLAPGHHADGSVAPVWDFNALAGAGALRSTAQDLLRYVQAHMRAAVSDAAPYALVQRPQRSTSIDQTQVGFTWRIKPFHGRTVVWHQGSTGGYASFVGFTSDGQRGVVVLTNTASEVGYIGLNSLVPVDTPAQ